MLTGELQFGVLLVHVSIELLLSPSVRLGYLWIEGVNIVTVIALDLAPLGGKVVVLAVECHAVLPVGHKAALVTLNHLQHLSMPLLLVFPYVSDCGSCKRTKGTSLKPASIPISLCLIGLILNQLIVVLITLAVLFLRLSLNCVHILSGKMHIMYVKVLIN